MGKPWKPKLNQWIVDIMKSYERPDEIRLGYFEVNQVDYLLKGEYCIVCMFKNPICQGFPA